MGCYDELIWKGPSEVSFSVLILLLILHLPFISEGLTFEQRLECSEVASHADV